MIARGKLKEMTGGLTDFGVSEVEQVSSDLIVEELGAVGQARRRHLQLSRSLAARLHCPAARLHPSLDLPFLRPVKITQFFTKLTLYNILRYSSIARSAGAIAAINCSDRCVSDKTQFYTSPDSIIFSFCLSLPSKSDSSSPIEKLILNDLILSHSELAHYTRAELTVLMYLTCANSM